MQYIHHSLKKVFSDALFVILAVSLASNLLVVYYLVFLKSTTFEVFFLSNNAFYNWASISLTFITALLFGIAVAMNVFVWRKKVSSTASSGGGSFVGAVFGAISTGCPVCGAYLLPMLGIAGSLAAFPFQGLEIKTLAIGLLAFSIRESSKSIAGVCAVNKKKLFSWKKNRLIVSLNRETLRQSKTFLIIGLAIFAVYLLPKLPPSYKFSFAEKNNLAANASAQLTNSSVLFEQVNPAQGYTLNTVYSDIGPKLLQAGAIDLEEFKTIYEKSGQPLTDKQLQVLTQGSNEKIKITSDNAYFLINLLWALGLANKNPILDEGQMTKYGKSQIGSFASTGGWTLGTKGATKLYSKSSIVKLTQQQQTRVSKAANGTYRPCCGNSTAFPDCNHGMAMLGLFQLMASQDATTDEMFEAAKYFNAFWFPQQYLDLAVYFQAKEGRDFSQVDARVLVSKDFSSGEGWSRVKRWLADNDLIEKAPSGGGACGV